MADEKVDVVEGQEVEVAESVQTMSTHDPVTQDGMDAVIAVAEKMDAFSKAMDTIMNAIIKRSYPGDWVCHARDGDSDDKKKANIGAAAAERIAMFLGIQERNWTPGVKTMHDDGKNYTWMYEADFGFKSRWIHVISRASSKDSFFGVAYGKAKPIEDIKEDDIRMAAFRGCRKEGVRGLLGLRGIPIDKLKELGYDTSKVNFINRKEKGKELDASAKTVNAETGLATRKIAPSEIVPFPWSKAEERDPKTKQVTKAAVSGVRYEITDIDRTKWVLWAGNASSKRYAALLAAAQVGEEVEVQFRVRKSDKGDQYTIEKVNGIAE